MNQNILRTIQTFLFLLLFLFAPIWAQFDGIKIMINPGHGGHDSNDRFISDTGFWESEGNLTKGLHLRDMLEARGAEIVMSRTQNRTEDDLALSQISAIANANNVDYFQSIHSNGFRKTANRTSVFWEQKSNGQPDFPAAKIASEILANKIFEVNFTTSTATHGDLQYLGFNLGVLSGLQMPGCLTEGSFHDYIPESYRLLNLDYRKHEAVAILRGMLQYFNLPSLEHGAVAGLAKDKSQTVSYNYTGGKTNDKYRPITNILASLYQDTTSIKSYHGDFNNNGYFVFDSIAPGSYTLVVDDGSYTADTSQITVNANKTTFKEVFLELDLEKTPLVYSTLPTNTQTNINTYSSLEITFSRPMNTDSTEEAFSLLPHIDGLFSWKEKDQVMVFEPVVAFTPQTNYQVTITTKAQNNSNIHLDENYEYSFVTADAHIYPRITKTIPAQDDSITIFEKIELFFDQEMIHGEVEQAFTVEPNISGTFNWIDDKHFIFTPDSLLINTFYTITITNNARNSLSVGLENDYNFSFKTYKRSDLNILNWFPSEGNRSISALTSFYFHFDAILNPGTVIANISLQDENQNNIELDSYKLEERNGTSVLRFDAKNELNRNKQYFMTVLPGIKDVDDLLFEDTLKYSFTTEIETYDSGLLIDDFELETGWQNPEFGSATKNVDLENSLFQLSFSEKINGDKSAKISYQFTGDSLGICQVYREEPYVLHPSDSSSFGLWIYGDYSFNTLELWYDINGQQNKSIKIDTLNYSGWKLIKLPVNLFGDSDISLHSIVVKQEPGAYQQSEIYVDDLQYDVVTGVQNDSNLPVVSNYKLQQNYPNPFNPKTTINYELPATGFVELTIYNLLGQKVETLVSAKQQPGTYKVVWDASQFSSGVYYYRIQSDPSNGLGQRFVQVRKMIVLK